MIESSLIRALKEEISMFIHVPICWWPFVPAGPGVGTCFGRSARAHGPQLCVMPHPMQLALLGFTGALGGGG